MNPLIELDRDITVAINDFGPAWLDAAMAFLSKVWVWVPLYVAVILWTLWRHGWRKALLLLGFAILTVIATDQISVLIKNTVCRLRPCQDPTLSGLIHMMEKYQGLYGFPSGHACNTFAFALLTSYSAQRRWWPPVFFGWASLVTFSRIYDGMHFLGDCIAGALLGLAIAAVFVLVFRWVEQKLKIEKRC